MAKPEMMVQKELAVAPQNSLNTSQRIAGEERIHTDEDMDSSELTPEQKIF